MSGFLRAIATAASMVIATSTTTLAQSAPPKLPFAITCYVEANGSWVVGYLRDVNSDGSATYMPPGGRVSVTLGADGIVQIPDDRSAASDCFGKSLDELRASRRLLEAATEN